MDVVSVEAVSCVFASDGVWRDPGARWACPADEAGDLLARGAVRRVEGAETPPAGPAPDPAGDLTLVSGIGPSTAADLRAAGVETLADLAALTDGGLEDLPVDAGFRRRVLGWRDQARLLTARNLGGPEPPAS